jgi:hypothetical protein
MVDGAVQNAAAELKRFPLPPTLPPAPVLSVADQATAQALEIANATQAAAAASLAATVTTNARAEHTAAALALRDVEARQREIQQNTGAWNAYQEAAPKHADAVTRIKAEWDRWNKAIKLVEAAEREFNQNTGDTFVRLVEGLGEEILQGRKITIDMDNGIRIGTDSMDLLSGSANWRAEVAIISAIAQTCKSPLLVIDGADILDSNNKELFVDFLMQKVVPKFEHVLVTSTLRGNREDESPSGVPEVTKWMLTQGILTKIGGR